MSTSGHAQADRDIAGRRIVTLLNPGGAAADFPLDVGDLCLLETDAPGDGRPRTTVPGHGWSILGRAGD